MTEPVIHGERRKEVGSFRPRAEAIVAVCWILLEWPEVRGQPVVVVVQQDAWHVGHVDGQAAMIEQFDHLGHRLGLFAHLSAFHG